MKREFGTLLKTTLAVGALLLTLVLSGCATQTGGSAKTFEDNFRFVPRIHVEDNSFGTTGHLYRHCQYDWYYDGYWCIKN